MFKSEVIKMFEYPHNVVRIMRSEVEKYKNTIRVHFSKRHVYGNGPAKNWIGAYRELVKNSGYDKALKQIGG